MPSRPEADAAIADIERLKTIHAGTIVIDHVLPDYHARYPKASMGGWGQRTLNVTPSGRVLPCHAAETIPGLEFWSVRDQGLGEIWFGSPAFNAFRGTDWMPDPCRSCERKNVDFGGDRCQALALLGEAGFAVPACSLSPFHFRIERLAAAEATEAAPSYTYRAMGDSASFRQPAAARPAASTEPRSS